MADTELRIRIKPEMLSSAKGQLANIQGQASGGSGGGALSGLQGMKGVGGVAKMMPAITAGVAGITAVLGGIMLVVKALSSYKPLMNMINAITKILQLFLRPIADVIIVLLMPVLYILKPILMVANQLIAPYRRLAFQMLAAGGQAMQEGDTAGAAMAFQGAFMTMFSGVNVFIIGLFSEVVKLSIAGLGELLKATTGAIIKGIGGLLALIPMFGDKLSSGADAVADKVSSGIDVAVGVATTAVDLAATTMLLANATAIAGIATALGVSSTEQIQEFVDGVETSMKSVFSSEASVTMIEKWAGAMGTALDKLDEGMVTKIGELETSVAAALQGVEELPKPEEIGGGTKDKEGGFWSKVLKGLQDAFEFIVNPIGMAIDLFKTTITDAITNAITGEGGIMTELEVGIGDFKTRQTEIVQPIIDLVARVDTEIGKIADIKVPKIGSSSGGIGIVRSAFPSPD